MLPKGWSKSYGPALVPKDCVLFWEHLLDSFGGRMSFWTVGLLPSMESLEKEMHELSRGSHTLTLLGKKLCWKTSTCWVMGNERSWPKHKNFTYFNMNGDRTHSDWTFKSSAMSTRSCSAWARSWQSAQWFYKCLWWDPWMFRNKYAKVPFPTKIAFFILKKKIIQKKKSESQAYGKMPHHYFHFILVLEARRVQNCPVCRGEGLRGVGRTDYGFQRRSNRSNFPSSLTKSSNKKRFFKDLENWDALFFFWIMRCNKHLICCVFCRIFLWILKNFQGFFEGFKLFA